MIDIRWMIRRDMPEVLAIEQGFEFPWSEDDFIRCLRQRNCIGMIAEHNERVVGFMIYELHKTRLHILNFAVHPGCQRRGVGAAMVNKLKGKLSPYRRSRIMLEIRESNLEAQCFFRAMGFATVHVIRDFYEDTPDDAYLFQFKHQPIELRAGKVVAALPDGSVRECRTLEEAEAVMDQHDNAQHVHAACRGAST
jgi:ribosomal-protein-alanine N-acetyltransferase